MNTKYYRRYIEKLIAANPVEIIITRTTTTDDGYGGDIESENELEPQKVTIYDKRATKEVISEAGRTAGYMTTTVSKLLSTYEADIQEKDTFEHAGKSYRVLFVKAYLDVCKQIELEVI